MQGRERKIVRAALRACQDALAEIEPVATGDRPASALAIARAIRTLLEGQVAILEALGGPALAREAADEPELASHPMPHYASTLPEAERGRKPAPKPAPEAGFAPEPPAPAAPAAAGPRKVHSDMAVEAIRAFELEALNKWIASGTVFQIRGVFAFLNMNSMGGGKVDEMSGYIRKMGFTEELGKLESQGVTGAILLFRKPE